MARHTLFFDGACSLCATAAWSLSRLDPFDALELVDLRAQDPARHDARLSRPLCAGQVMFLESDGRLSGGFEALRRLSLRLPALWPAALVLRLPGATRWGPRLYERLARWRYERGLPLSARAALHARLPIDGPIGPKAESGLRQSPAMQQLTAGPQK